MNLLLLKGNQWLCNFHIFETEGMTRDYRLKPDWTILYLKSPRGLSIFQDCQEIRNSERRRANLVVEYRQHVNNKKMIPKVQKVFKENKSFHKMWQVCNATIIGDYLKHIHSKEHALAVKEPRNVHNYKALDRLIEEISQDHFEGIFEREELRDEDKENISSNGDMLLSVGNSRITQNNWKLKNGEGISTFPTGSETMWAQRVLNNALNSRRVLKKIEENHQMNRNDRTMSYEERKANPYKDNSESKHDDSRDLSSFGGFPSHENYESKLFKFNVF